MISLRSDFNVQQTVGVGIDGGAQSELLVVELDHGLVNGYVIRVRAIGGL